MKLDKVKMNSTKFELNKKLHQELIMVDDLITKYGVAEDDQLTRNHIDRRRQLFAEYEQTLIGLLSSEPNEKDSELELYRANPELNEFIDLWCGQIRNLEFRPIYLTDQEYCQRFVDCYLPKSWNWETDFVMLINPFEATLLKELANRGQKNIIVLSTKESATFSDGLRSNFDEFWELTSLKELESALWFYPRKVSNICHFDCLGQSESEITSEKITKIIKEGIYVRQINMNTIGKHSMKWATNSIRNIPNILQHENISSLSLMNAKTGVIVSPGPSLEKNVHLLKDCADNVFIICPVRAVPILRANGVEPDFVIQLDAIGGSFLKNARNSVGLPVKNLILDATVDPGFFDFPAENKFWYFTQNKTLGLEEYIDCGKFGLEAVSVSIACLKFAYNFGLTKLVLIGQDLAFSGGKRYSSGGGLNWTPIGDSTADILVDGYYGGKVPTAADYDYFIGQFVELGKLMGEAGCEMYNCTEGGAYIKNFEHIPLSQCLSNISDLETKITLVNEGQVRDIEDGIKFCKKSRALIQKVEGFGRRAFEIETKADLSNDDVKNRDKHLRKMIKFSDQSKILWWAFQDVIMSTQELTYQKESVSDLRSFLLEIIEITTVMTKTLNQTEGALIAKLNSENTRG